MVQNQGNSYGRRENGTVKVSTINVWNRITSRIPVGLVLKASETYPPGSVVPAGLPVSGTEMGGEATVGAAADMTKAFSGLNEKDVVMGPQCCTLDVINGGELLIDRISATISDSQKTALKEKIYFYTQYKE